MKFHLFWMFYDGKVCVSVCLSSGSLLGEGVPRADVRAGGNREAGLPGQGESRTRHHLENQRRAAHRWVTIHPVLLLL